MTISPEPMDIGGCLNTQNVRGDHIMGRRGVGGCVSVIHFHIQKATVVKILSSGKQLRKLGDLQIQMADVIYEYTLLVAVCCGSLESTDMTSLRYTVWLAKMSNPKLNSAPDLKALTLKSEVFEECVYRTDIQTAI